MTTANPFHQAPADAPVDQDLLDQLEPDALWDDAVAWSGPPIPPPTPASQPAPAWATVEVMGTPQICVMGVHGGAGTTTVASLLGAAALDVGTAWPVASGWARPLPVLPVVAVARTHHRGIEAATRLARRWAAGALGDSRLVGLVLVDDGPNLTVAQRKAARQLGRMTPHGWHLPWQEAWRVTAPELPTAPARVRRVMKSITNSTKETN